MSLHHDAYRLCNQDSGAGSADRYRRLFELAGDGILLVKDARFIDCNPRAAEMLGYESPMQLINTQPSDISPEIQPDGSISAEYASVLVKAAYRTPLVFEWVHLKRGGELIDIEVSLTLFDQEDQILLCHWRDISDRKQAERSLSNATRLLERTGHLAQVGGWEYNFVTGELELSRQMQLMIGGQVESPVSVRRILRLMAAAHRPRGFQHLREVISKGGAAEVDIEVEFLLGKKRWWRISTERVTQGNGLSLLVGAVQDVTEVKKARFAKERKQQEIKRGQLQLMQSMSLALEKRDPYTAGHQSHVATLARAIAEQMGFDTDRLEGLFLGATLHDLGKIAIPAEILTRPGRLCEEEMSLVRLHPQTGYEIIKDVSFPWPIAEMVLQHQERYDGSGYPAGLKGEEIILEARIIAVADVVEAMASHRPYRAALGIDAALDEIKRNKSRLYDPQVVDACLSVFAGGYQL